MTAGNSVLGIKMLLRLVILASTIILLSTAYMCPEPDVCTCIGSLLSCICTTRKDVTLSAILNFDIRQISVKGCGTVLIPFGSMTHLQLESVELEDLDSLNIRPFAFAGVQNLDTLRLAHIDSLDIQTYGFSGINNATSIILDNVTCSTLTTGAFGGLADVGELRVSRSIFGTVQSMAFYISNISTVEVIDSTFKVMENASMLIHSSESVTFVGCQLTEITTQAISLSFVDNLSFIQCNFGVIHSGSISAKSLETFTVKNCTAEELHEDAFKEAETYKRVTYSYNSVERAHKNSIFPESWIDPKFQPFRQGPEIVGNEFNCDCHLSWMWTRDSSNDAYRDLLDGSSCIWKFSNERLSSLAPKFDTDGKCLSIELDSGTERPNILNGNSTQLVSSSSYDRSNVYIYVLTLLLQHCLLCTVTCE